MNIWKINRDTGLPFTPEGFEWELFFNPEVFPEHPYKLLLKRRGSGEEWWGSEVPTERWDIVYTSFLKGATGYTIRPRHVRKTAREILRKCRKVEHAREQNENGNPAIKPGTYPPNKI